MEEFFSHQQIAKICEAANSRRFGRSRRYSVVASVARRLYKDGEQANKQGEATMEPAMSQDTVPVQIPAPIATDLQPFDAVAETLIQYEPASNDSLTAPKTNKTHQLREILNAMLTTRTVNGVTQRISIRPVSREDVIKLQISLDDRLQLRQAREIGICPVREELYSQTFDELIRQVTIECPERGLLLLRIRDESKMNIAAYQTLYESSIVFGIRKSLQAEIGTGSLAEKIAASEARKSELKTELDNLRTKYETIEKQESERKSFIDKKRQEEKEFVKFQRQHLETFLKQTVG